MNDAAPVSRRQRVSDQGQMRNVSATGSGPRVKRVASVSPGTYCMTMYGRPVESMPKSCTGQMPG